MAASLAPGESRGGGAAALEPASGDGARFGGINALRALAAFAVLACHVPLIAPLPDGPALFLVRQLGFGVSLFFVISGFLLFRPLARALDKNAPVDIGAYFQSRAFRILPLYLVVVAVIFSLDSSRRGVDQVIRSLTFTGVYSGARIPDVVYPVSWSLDDEVVFYLFLPVLFLLVAWLVKPGRRFRAVTMTVVALGIASVLYRVVLVSALGVDPRGPEGDPILLRSFPGKLDLFAAGMLLAVVVLRYSPRLRGNHVAGLLAAGVVTVAVGDAVFLAVKSIADVLMGAGFAAVLAAVVFAPSGSAFAAVMTSAPLRFLGEISYGVFLWHSFVLRQLHLHGLRGAGYIVTLLVTAGITIALATTSYFLVERPFLRRKLPWVRQQRGGAATAAG